MRTFEQALALWVEKYMHLDGPPTEVRTDSTEGEDYSYSEYSGGHEDATFVVEYRVGTSTTWQKISFSISDFAPDGFGGLLRDIVKLAQDPTLDLYADQKCQHCELEIDHRTWSHGVYRAASWHHTGTGDGWCHGIIGHPGTQAEPFR